MTPKEMRDRAGAIGPEALVEELIDTPVVLACQTDQVYATFRGYVQTAYPNASQVFIAGSGNWGFSLKPENNLRPFGNHSDIDVGVIHPDWFNMTWEELRRYHRQFFYALGRRIQAELRRNGENVYSGFVSPTWIPDKGNNFRFQHAKILNALTSQLVGYKPVRMLFFKNRPEAIDYYKRGILLLQDI
jgi:hypothetical protein